jgi:uncharacterized lipoprotein YddW (UPF0748 family)
VLAFVFVAVVALGLTLAQVAPPPLEQTRPAPVQLRGLWVDAFGPGFKTPNEVTALVNYAAAMRLNALFVQVGRRMDCYCNRASVPRSADPAFQAGFDALDDIIAKAHARGIQVHAWIITTSAYNSTEPYVASNHVMNTNGPTSANSWITQQQDGTKLAGKDYVLDPGHPAAAEYIARFYGSVVQNYDVDGIQFDRVRYPDSGDAAFRPVWGYNPVALARFRLETGRTDTPAPLDAQWSQWRRDQVSNLVRRVYLETKAAKPNLWVSAATIVYKTAPTTLDEWQRTRTYAEVLQDWVGWQAAGVLDLNLPMNYKRENNPEQQAEFGGWARFAAAQRAKGVLGVGAAVYLNTLSDSLKQYARAVSIPGVSGWVGYSYRTPDADTFAGKKTTPVAQQDLLRAFALNQNAPFAQAATWGRPNAQNLSGVIGRVTRGGVGASNANVQLSGADGSSVLVKTDSNGYYGVPSLPVGRVGVAVIVGDAQSRALEVMVATGRVLRAPDLELNP